MRSDRQAADANWFRHHLCGEELVGLPDDKPVEIFCEMWSPFYAADPVPSGCFATICLVAFVSGTHEFLPVPIPSWQKLSVFALCLVFCRHGRECLAIRRGLAPAGAATPFWPCSLFVSRTFPAIFLGRQNLSFDFITAGS